MSGTASKNNTITILSCKYEVLSELFQTDADIITTIANVKCPLGSDICVITKAEMYQALDLELSDNSPDICISFAFHAMLHCQDSNSRDFLISRFMVNYTHPDIIIGMRSDINTTFKNIPYRVYRWNNYCAVNGKTVKDIELKNIIKHLIGEITGTNAAKVAELEAQIAELKCLSC